MATGILVYFSQTSYVPLTKNQTHVASETPVTDPSFSGGLKAWHFNKLDVNISALSKETQTIVRKNIRSLRYPVRISTNKNAVIVTKANTPKGSHAITTNTGSLILIDPTYADQQSDKVALTITHEIGHSLGLLHTYDGTIMYPYNDGHQTVSLNDAQKLYLKHLRSMTPLTHWILHQSGSWDYKSANEFELKNRLGKNNLNLYAPSSFQKQAMLSAQIVIYHVLIVVIMFEFLYWAIFFIATRYSVLVKNP